jgi:hypothetical protein
MIAMDANDILVIVEVIALVNSEPHIASPQLLTIVAAPAALIPLRQELLVKQLPIAVASRLSPEFL